MLCEYKTCNNMESVILMFVCFYTIAKFNHQLTGFCIMATLAFNELVEFANIIVGFNLLSNLFILSI